MFKIIDLKPLSEFLNAFVSHLFFTVKDVTCVSKVNLNSTVLFGKRFLNAGYENG